MAVNIESSYRELLKSIGEKPASKEVLESLESITSDIHRVLLRVGLDQDYDRLLEDQAFSFFFGENGFESDQMFNDFIESSDYKEVNMDCILDYISSRIDYLLSQKETLEELAELFGIEMVASKRVLLEPMDLQTTLDGDGSFENVREFSENKSKLILGMLFDNGVTAEDINVVTGVLRKNMMRQESYNCIEIASLGVKIFVNNGYGEATYILTGNESWRDLFGKTKNELIEDFGAVRLKFSESDVEGWLASISSVVFKSSVLNLDNQTDICESMKSTQLDQNYFQNHQFVLFDLKNYAEVIGTNIEDLLVNNASRSVRIVLSNGKECTWNTYVLNAAVKLGIAKNRREAETYKKITIRKLLIVAGFDLPEIIDMNEEYFDNIENLRNDLEEFRKAQGKDSVLDVAIGRTEKVMCACGQELNIGTYLNNFGVVYEGVNGVRDLENTHKELLIIIFSYIGLEFREYKDMDEEYFDNIENLRNDLEEFRKAQGKSSLTEIIIQPTYVICTNGELVNLISYLERYGKVICGLESKHEISMTHSEIRNHALSVIGLENESYKAMDSNYFNYESARFDLTQFAEVICLSVTDLTTNRKYINKKANCSNGELVAFRNFLHRAKVALGSPTLRSALDDLRLLGGFCTELSDPMDSDYFTRENLMHDLGLFCKELGVSDIGQLELNSSSRYSKVICSNGEEVSLLIYIGRVTECIFGDDKRRVSKESLRNVQRYLGYDSISEMNREYFSVENICYDLGLFAVEVSGDDDFRNLPYHKNTRGVVVKCSNGEFLSLRAYLYRVMKEFEGEYPDINTVSKMLKLLKGFYVE